ncbi:MAG: hypothetical protein AAGH19_00525 [Pseudomonadota bacterium]
MLTVLLLCATFVAPMAFADLAEERLRADTLLADGEDKKAFKAYRDLARAGDQDAQYLVSVFYAQGRGTKVDVLESYGWSVVAAEAGLDKLDQHSRERYEAVPEDKRKKAEKKARSLMRKYGQEALQIKAERLAARGSGARQGACTGSRLNCRGATNSTHAPAYDGIAPPVASGGN